MFSKEITYTKPEGFIYKFLWRAHPLWALVEAWVLGALTLLALSRIVDGVSNYVLTNGLFFLCGLCGMWMVLRARLVEGTLVRQALIEIGIGTLISAMMVGALFLPAQQLGWEGVWLKSTIRNSGTTSLLFGMTGPGYLAVRVGVRMWLGWERLRRKRMLWAVTHAHLTAFVVVVILSEFGLLVLALFGDTVATGAEANTVFAVAADRFLHSVFPALAVTMVILVVTLITVLPPSLLLSFLIARRTTKRLEELAAATEGLREGDYSTRVTVSGEDEVGQLQGTFNAMAVDLEQAMRDLQEERDKVTGLLQSRRELIAGVSHELRTPLATTRGYLDALRATLDAPRAAIGDRDVAVTRDVMRDLEVMERELLRLQALIDDLFTLSRTEAGGLALDVQPTDVGAVIQRRVQAVAPLAWQRERVDVVANVPPDLPLALVDAGRLDQVLVNLLRNALRHTPPGGIVAVSAEPEEGETIHIEVCDTGEGIPPEVLPRIWERFYRGEGSRSESGAGLGLALVKELIEAMGGSVDVRSVVGEGSCFVVVVQKADDVE